MFLNILNILMILVFIHLKHFYLTVKEFSLSLFFMIIDIIILLMFFQVTIFVLFNLHGLLYFDLILMLFFVHFGFYSIFCFIKCLQQGANYQQYKIQVQNLRTISKNNIFQYTEEINNNIKMSFLSFLSYFVKLRLYELCLKMLNHILMIIIQQLDQFIKFKFQPMTSTEYNIKTSQILQKLQFKLEKYFTPKYQAQNDQKTNNFRQIMSKCQRLKSYHKSAIEQNEDWLEQLRKKQFKQNQKKLRMNKNIQEQPSSSCEQKLTFILQQHKKQQVQQLIVYQKNKQHYNDKHQESAKRKSNSPSKQQKDSSQLILQKLQYLQSRIDKLQFNKSKTSPLALSNSKNNKTNKLKFNKNKSQTQKKSQTNKSKRINYNNSKQKSGKNSNRKVKTQQEIRSTISIINNNSELKHFQSNISPKPKLKKVGTYYKKIQTKKGELKKKVNNKQTPNGESQVKSIFSLLPKVRSAEYL